MLNKQRRTRLRDRSRAIEMRAIWHCDIFDTTAVYLIYAMTTSWRPQTGHAE